VVFPVNFNSSSFGTALICVCWLRELKTSLLPFVSYYLGHPAYAYFTVDTMFVVF